MVSTVMLAWLMLSVFVAFAAVPVGRSPLLWFAIAILLSPVVALAVLLIVWESSRNVAPAAPAPSISFTGDELLEKLERLFNDGRLSVNDDARLRALARREPPRRKEKSAPLTDVEEFTRACPSCARMIHPKATTCMHCFAKVAIDSTTVARTAAPDGDRDE